METTTVAEAGKYVTFELGEEMYALPIGKVREVLDVAPITKVPQTPPSMRGVINLRGSVVPVVDLRLKFGMSATVNTVNTRVVIVEISVDEETTVLGALADSVREVIELEPGQIRPPPRIGTRLRTEFIQGMGKCGEEFIIILNIDKVFSMEDLLEVRAAELEPGAQRPARPGSTSEHETHPA